MKWWWEPRYEAVIHGRYSGNVTVLPFVRFRHVIDMQAWVINMNIANKQANTGIYYGFRDIRTGKVVQ